MPGFFDALGAGIVGGNASKDINKRASQNIARLDPYNQNGLGANGLIASLLGIGGGTGGAEGLDHFRESTGYQDTLNSALNGVSSNAAARGLLGSSGTGKIFQTTAANLAQGSFGDFLKQLMGQQSLGLNAATNQANIGLDAAKSASAAKASGGIFGSLFG